MTFSWEPNGTPVEFTWNPDKAQDNVKKHGVTFTEAATVFDDVHAKSRVDRDHHERRILTGYSSEQHLLIVVHIEILDENRVRIISARKAEPKERRAHERFTKGAE